NERNAVEAPITANLLRDISDISTHPRGLAYFSVLQPRVHIGAHCGPTNARIRAHLGIRVPDGAVMRVGTETRSWTEGKCLVFDDSWEHEVFNRSDFIRAVLLLDIWHPDLTSEQRSELVEADRDRRNPTGSEDRRREGWKRQAPVCDAPLSDEE